MQVACARLNVEWLSQMDGAGGLAAARTEKPDLIILDVAMPEKNGWEVLRELKVGAETSAIPVLMLTAQGDEEEVAQALRAGAEFFIHKPFHPLEIANLLQRILA
jgi:DNA-binding response OmpR family regulator